MVVFMKQVGTVELFMEVINMSMKTTANGSRHVFKPRPEILSGSARLRTLTQF